MWPPAFFFIIALPRAYSDFPCERAPFLIGVSVRPFVLGLRGPRFPASSSGRARSASSSCVRLGSCFPDVISFFSRAYVRLRAFFSSCVKLCCMSSLASIIPSRSATAWRCRSGTGAGEGWKASAFLGRCSATTVSLSPSRRSGMESARNPIPARGAPRSVRRRRWGARHYSESCRTSLRRALAWKSPRAALQPLQDLILVPADAPLPEAHRCREGPLLHHAPQR